MTGARGFKRFGLIVLIAGLLVVPAPRPLAADDDDHCQGRRPRLHRKESHARVHFVGVLHDREERHGRHFAAERLRDLVIVVSWRRLDEIQHRQRVDLYTPEGALYQRFAALASGERPVEIRVPVSGTWIAQHRLFGTWCAEVFLDDAAEPTAWRSFVIAPAH